MNKNGTGPHITGKIVADEIRIVRRPRRTRAIITGSVYLVVVVVLFALAWVYL